MTVTASVREGVLDVEVRGIGSHLLVSSGDHHIPMADIVEARVVGWEETRAGLGWRTCGGYWPGWFATGWYSVPGRRGAWQILSVYRDRDELLLVDTRLERPARLVLAVPNPHGLADEIHRQVAARGKGG